VDYEFGRRIEQVISAPGSISRLSVGVIVPGALDEAKRQRISDLVRVAAGINPARGDAIVVEPLDQLGTAQAAASLPAPVVSSVHAEVDAHAAAERQPAASASTAWRTIMLLVAAAAVIALALGLLLGRAVPERRKSLSPAERQQLLLELETALGPAPARDARSGA
jgi:flagellar M-ring protein FliF